MSCTPFTQPSAWNYDTDVITYIRNCDSNAGMINNSNFSNATSRLRLKLKLKLRSHMWNEFMANEHLTVSYVYIFRMRSIGNVGIIMVSYVNSANPTQLHLDFKYHGTKVLWIKMKTSSLLAFRF